MCTQPQISSILKRSQIINCVFYILVDVHKSNQLTAKFYNCSLYLILKYIFKVMNQQYLKKEVSCQV